MTRYVKTLSYVFAAMAGVCFVSGLAVLSERKDIYGRFGIGVFIPQLFDRHETKAASGWRGPHECFALFWRTGLHHDDD